MVNVHVRHTHKHTRLALTGEARHPILLTQGFSFAVGINLSNNDLVLDVLERIGEFFILGCEIFAVTASAHVITRARIMDYYTTYHQGAKL